MSCGKCPVSLMCYRGKLNEIHLCPLCNILEVYIFNEGYTRIKCAKRRCDTRVKDRWFTQYVNAMNREEHSTPIDLYVRVAMKDPGPAQEDYWVYTGHGTRKLNVMLCDYCYNELRKKNKVEKYEEIKNILEDNKKCRVERVK